MIKITLNNEETKLLLQLCYHERERIAQVCNPEEEQEFKALGALMARLNSPDSNRKGSPK